MRVSGWSRVPLPPARITPFTLRQPRGGSAPYPGRALGECDTRGSAQRSTTASESAGHAVDRPRPEVPVTQRARRPPRRRGRPRRSCRTARSGRRSPGELRAPVQCGALPSRISKPSPQSQGSNRPKPGRTPARPGKATDVASARVRRDTRRGARSSRGQGEEVAERPTRPRRGRGPGGELGAGHLEREDHAGAEVVGEGHARGARPRRRPASRSRRWSRSGAGPARSAGRASRARDPRHGRGGDEPSTPGGPAGSSRPRVPSSVATRTAMATSSLVTDAHANGRVDVAGLLDHDRGPSAAPAHRRPPAADPHRPSSHPSRGSRARRGRVSLSAGRGPLGGLGPVAGVVDLAGRGASDGLDEVDALGGLVVGQVALDVVDELGLGGRGAGAQLDHGGHHLAEALVGDRRPPRRRARRGGASRPPPPPRGRPSRRRC